MSEIYSYRIETSNAVFRLSVRGIVIVAAAPIAKWTIGYNIGFVLDYYRRRGAKIESL